MAAKVAAVEKPKQEIAPALSDTWFDEALSVATAKPADESPWERLEAAVVSNENHARQLLDFYRAHIGNGHAKPIVAVLSQRAARFAADCFGDNAAETVDVLRAVLKAAPEADWAFRPLLVALTMGERWREALDAYDARLGRGVGAERRAEILEDAARIAKDFTTDHARAIGYLDQLSRLRPGDGQVASSLERLLERHERWIELVAARRLRLEGLTGGEARELRLRIAITLHDKLHEPEAALAELRPLLSDLREEAQLGGLLERLLADERAQVETRLEALDALRPRFEASGAVARVPELLRTAIGFAGGDRLRALRRECAERLDALGDVSGALDQVVALIALAPEDRAVEDRLRQLADAAHDPARLAAGLVAAAEACSAGDRRAELLVRAARVEDRPLGHSERAAALFEAALSGDAGTAELRLDSLRRLEELYDALGDKPHRLGALERLAAGEPKPGGKRLTWALAAELALELGDVDRALAAWNARLMLDPADGEALAAAHGLLVRVERWPAVIDVLRRRIDGGPAAHQIRVDLVEIATVARDRLSDRTRAIEAWHEVVARFGDDEESVGALADLYADTGAFAELAALLSRTASVDRGRHADRLARLADAQRLQLADAAAAVEWYGRALDVDPAHGAARAGLLALTKDGEVGARAATRLAAAADATDDWQLALDLVPARLAGVEDPRERAWILERAAARAEARAGDAKRALAWLCEALPLAGASARLEREVMRLAEATGDYAPAARAIGETIAAGGIPPLTLAHLHELRGGLLETRLGDPGAASESYAAVLALAPDRVEPRRSLLRTLVRLDRFADAAALLVDVNAAPDARDGVLLPLFESLALEHDAIGPAISALAKAVEEASGLPAAARRDLYVRIGGLLMEHAGDVDAAEQALSHALAADPRHVPTLERLAELERRRPDRRLVETLSRLAVEQPDNLDYLHEAAALAATRLADEALALDLHARARDRAGELLAWGAPATGRHAAEDVAAAAIDEIARLHAESGAPERVRAAVAILVDADRLRVGEERRRGWLRRAAELTEGALDDRSGAIRIWRALHDKAPDDDTAREALGRLYEVERRFADAVSLRVAELERTRAPERRLYLRLEIVRLAGLLEQASDAPEVLRASLGERPGHAPTLAKLTEVLLAKGRPGELADIREDQARILEENAEPGAAALWADAARLVENPLGDAGRAMRDWQNAARLEPGTEALDALGRLALAAGDGTAAAEWLDRRLAMTEGPARDEVADRLAVTYLAAGQRHRAIACLERALAESPRAEPLRTRLAELYRGAGAWEPLARVLGEGCEHGEDDALTVTRATEVAEIYGRLGLLERAVPVLAKAVRLVPNNETLGLALADGLAHCGRLDEARGELERLVEQSGWRRTRKRALLHQRLADIANAQGDTTRALAELEQASSMDVSSPAILRRLAEVAEAAGDLDRAERAMRALLVQTRGEARDDARPHAEPATAILTHAEILLRLHGLARKRGRTGEAEELLDSALAAAIKDPEQAMQLQRGLLEAGAYDELARFYEKRLAQAAGTPAEPEIWAEMADSLRAEAKHGAAFDAQWRAVELAPENGRLHAPLVTLARESGQLEPLCERVLALCERRRRKADTAVAASLLLLASGIAEHDLGDSARALDLLRRAEELQPRSLAVLSALARLARDAGDVGEQDRLAVELKRVAAESRGTDVAEALYQAAALELGRADTRDAGVASLCQALDQSRDIERASALVAAAGVPEAEMVNILPLYERIARQSGDDRMLFDYLDRRAAAADVTVPEVREAIDLAMALGREDRLHALLLRLADVAVERADGRDDAAWALLELLRIRKAAGDLDGAAHALARAAEVLPFDRVLPLARDLAERAGRAGNRRLGAELLERLRASAPADESVWRPLLDHYIQLGDGDGLARLVAATLPLVPEVGPRNELRLAVARLRLAGDPTDRDAADTLRDVLLEEPGRAEALSLLAGYYERTGSEQDLVDLLEQVFDAAISARDANAAVAAAVRLGAALEPGDAARAAETYERALALAPKRPELLRSLLALRPAGELRREDAARMEELLALESGPAAERLARELAAAWTSFGDAGAARRALESGYARAGAASALFDELEQLYRTQQDWKQLADLHATEGDRREDGKDAARLLLEAASLRHGRVADPRGALELLRRARKRAPHDVQIVEQLARALVAHGDLAAAVGEVRSALGDGDLDPTQRLPLTLLRAKLESARGDHRAAATVLQDAMASSPETVGPLLAAELESWRQEAATTRATDDLREVTFRLADLARAAGDLGQARRLLTELTAHGASDAQTARLTWELAEAEGDTEGAFAALAQLVPVSTGESQLTAAHQLVALAEQNGRAAEAAAAIESAYASSPGQPELGNLLAALYEQSGDFGKLAGLLLDQGNRNPDEAQRFEQLTRAGSIAMQAGDASVAVMSLTEALAIHPEDEQATLLLSDAYVMSGAPAEAGELLKPLAAARKGKPSQMLAAVELRLAQVARMAGDRDAQVAALAHALDADKKNNEVVAEVADRAEEAGDDELALKALRLIVANTGPGPISVPAAFLRQAHIALRRNDTDRAVMFARRAAHDAPKGDPAEIDAREFLKLHAPAPARPRR